MSVNPTAGLHNPGEAGDLRRAVAVTEPDLMLLVAATRGWLQAREAHADADLHQWALTRAALARATELLERVAVPSASLSAAAHSHWTEQAMYPGAGDATHVANYHPEGTREAIIQRIHEEAGQ